jgi:amidase
MARTAEDLEAAMRVLGQTDPPFSTAYSWRLPAPRHKQLRGFRIGYMLEDPLLRVSSEVKPALESALKALERAGAKLQPGWPKGFSFKEFFDTYFFMLMAFEFSVAPEEEQRRRRGAFASAKNDPVAQASLTDFSSWQRQNFRRLAYRAAWQEYFRDIDAFLLPALPVPAFPHDHTEISTRTLATPEGPIPYSLGLLAYMSVAALTGCPATVAPAGKTPKGLPVGIQILGPFLEDATPIQLAGLLSKENGGVTPPPGY